MKTIDHSGFAPVTLNLAIDKWIRKAGKALNALKNNMGKVARLAHREPGFCEQHLLDQNLGPAIRRIWW